MAAPGPSQAEVETALATMALTAITISPPPPPYTEPFPWPVRAHRGWPLPASLSASLVAGCLTVTTRAKAGTWRDTTRWPAEWRTETNAPTLAASVTDDTAFFAGTGGAGQVVGVACDGQSWSYRCRDGDTPALAAASLAQLIRPTRLAIASGGTLRLPGATDLMARTGADAVASRELRRQQQVFEVTLWCAAPEVRDWAGGLLDLAITETPFLGVDGEACRMLGEGCADDDGSEVARLYKRVVQLRVEYPTLEYMVQPMMLFGVAVQDGSAQGESFG